MPRFELLLAVGLADADRGGLRLLWHERPDQPVTADDLRILEKDEQRRGITP